MSLGNNRDAICDLNIARNVESSTSGKQQVESELNIILDHSRSTNIVVQPQHKENSLSAVGKKLSLLSKWQIGQGFVDCTSVIVISSEVCLKSNVLHFEFIVFHFWILCNPLVCLCFSFLCPNDILQSWKSMLM